MPPAQAEATTKPNYREFMRGRRPELYSDTLHVPESEMDRRQFEFHLDTLTSRKEETAFENFARALAEKELCPNLIPQTGPTGGGDSKVDTETYPVAPSIAALWYEGSPTPSGSERWGFAVSAKAQWKPKCESDVQKIVDTGRPYTVIYFISNQAIRDKARAESEDALTAKHRIQVRILDRSWIVHKVSSNRRWQLVADTLQFQLQQTVKTIVGPLDTARVRDLETLDAKIEGTAGDHVTLELVEEALQSALLARSLDRPRTEIDGRFERAERLARGISSDRQQHRIWYQRAWTALWWFDDAAEALRLYDVLAPARLQSEWVWDLDELVNLWSALEPTQRGESTRLAQLKAALQAHAGITDKRTSSVWARTQLAFIDLVALMRAGQPTEPAVRALGDALLEAGGQVEFPMELVVKMLRELAPIIGEAEGYDELYDKVVDIEGTRHGESAKGELLLNRGLQKLSRKRSYEAIDDLAKAQMLLAKEEHRGQFIAALAGTGLAYESVGLLFAARASFVSALDRCLYAFVKEGTVDRRALPLFRKLAWVELQLGRPTYAFVWLKWLPVMQTALSLDPEAMSDLGEEVEALDRALGILVLKTPFNELERLTRLPDLLDSLGLHMSCAAALFMLGHEETVRSEYAAGDDDFQQFFSTWISSPAANDMPSTPEWFVGSPTLTTVILGCQIQVTARAGVVSAMLGEAALAFLEAFYSTSVQTRNLISPRVSLRIEVRQSDTAKAPFSTRRVEDECGETSLIVTHPPITASEMAGAGFNEAMFNLFANISAEFQIDLDRLQFEKMFANDRAQDRALHAARSVISVTNVLSDAPSVRLQDWVQEDTMRAFPLLRTTAWKAESISSPKTEGSAADEPLTFAEGEPPSGPSGADAIRHRDLSVASPINIPLWNRAKWKGTAVAAPGGEAQPPLMSLVFENVEDGRKIFRGWQKHVGKSDDDGWLSVTVITGIERESPKHYRVAIGAGPHVLRALQADSARFFAMVFRTNDMAPASNQNMQLLMQTYARAGKVVLTPGEFRPGQATLELGRSDLELRIVLKSLTFTPAWKIGPDSPLVGATNGIVDPVIPDDATDVPFRRVLEMRAELKAKARAADNRI